MPGIASLWAWAKLFTIRTNDLSRRVDVLERQIAGLENVVAVLQAVDATRLPPYEARSLCQYGSSITETILAEQQ